MIDKLREDIACLTCSVNFFCGYKFGKVGSACKKQGEKADKIISLFLPYIEQAMTQGHEDGIREVEEVVRQKVKEAVEFIESHLVTTVHPKGDMHHIDDKEWQSVKERVFKP